MATPFLFIAEVNLFFPPRSLAKGFEKPWVDFHAQAFGLSCILPGLFIGFFEVKGYCPVVVGLSIPGVDFQGPIVVGDGLVMLAFIVIGCSPVVIGLSIPGVDFQGPIVVGDGLVILAFFP